MAFASRGRQASDGFGTQRFGSSGDDALLPLLEALVDAQSLIGVRQLLHSDEPDALQKVDQQQRSRGELRGAEGVGMEKSTQHLRNGQTECFTMSWTALDN